MQIPAPLSLRPAAAWRATLVLLSLCAAMSLRVALGGADPAASQPAALVFVAVLAAIALASGVRIATPSLRWLAAGLAGGLLLFAVWAWAVGDPLGWRPAEGSPPLLLWSVIVTVVAVAEEVVLRGVLFGELLRWGGPVLALAISSLAFALLHVPLYGWQAVPVDCVVGVFLGGLRLLSGGIAAPAAAHAVADLAAGWLV